MTKALDHSLGSTEEAAREAEQGIVAGCGDSSGSLVRLDGPGEAVFRAFSRSSPFRLVLARQ